MNYDKEDLLKKLYILHKGVSKLSQVTTLIDIMNRTILEMVEILEDGLQNR